MDVDEIVNTLADFSNLEAELLMEEIDSCSQEIGENGNLRFVYIFLCFSFFR